MQIVLIMYCFICNLAGPDVEAPHVPGVLAASPGEQTALISITQPRCQWWRVTPHVSPSLPPDGIVSALRIKLQVDLSRLQY